MLVLLETKKRAYAKVGWWQNVNIKFHENWQLA
jgi:hypothetical protein